MHQDEYKVIYLGLQMLVGNLECAIRAQERRALSVAQEYIPPRNLALGLRIAKALIKRIGAKLPPEPPLPNEDDEGGDI